MGTGGCSIWQKELITAADAPRRFIPNREGQDLQSSYALLNDEGSPSTPSRLRRRPANGELHHQKSKAMNTESIVICLTASSR